MKFETKTIHGLKYIDEKKKQYENYTREVLIVNSKGKKLTTRSLRRLISGHVHEAGIEKEIFEEKMNKHKIK